MRPVSVAGLLLAWAAIAPFAFAQREYSPRLNVSLFGAEGHAYVEADGVATDPNGAVYQPDLYRGVIYKFSPDGKWDTIEAFFLDPNGERVACSILASGIAVDGAGNAYIASQRSIFRISPEGMTTVLAEGFLSARGIAVDDGGNIYVADTGSHVIYKIQPTGVKTVLAGQVDQPGNSDGTESARFNHPTAVAVDSGGIVYVADSGNHIVRKITPDGVVSTLAGLAGVSGRVDGPGAAARFDGPAGIAIDQFGAVYTTDEDYRIRRITPGGVVSTIAVSGGFGNEIEAGGLNVIALDRNGTIYVLDGWYGSILKSLAPPSFTMPIASQSVAMGGTASFGSDAIGAGPITFQWMKDGIAIADATNATLTIENVRASDLGDYSVRATNAVGTIVSNRAVLSLPVLTAANVEGLVSFSVQGNVGAGAQTMILGFRVQTPNTKDMMPLLLRGVGPSLGLGGVAGVLADPMLKVFSGRTEVAANDNWKGDALVSAMSAQVGAVRLASATSRDAALYHAGLSGGVYTMQIAGVGAGSGVALAEIYDARPTDTANVSTARLIHVSVRAQVGRSPQLLTARFAIAGVAEKTLLIRAIGPALGSFGITNPLVDPKLELFRAATLVQANDRWAGDPAITSAAARVGAFPPDPTSGDAALLVLLQPGTYTARVRGAADTTGAALLEIYEIP